MLRCSTLLSLGKYKSQLQGNLTSHLLECYHQEVTSVSDNVKKSEHLCTVSWNVNQYSYKEEQYGGASKTRKQNCHIFQQSHFCLYVQLFAILWTVARQAPLSMAFSRQEYWSGLPLLSPGDLPDPVIKPRSPTLQTDSSPSEPPGKPSALLGFVKSVIFSIIGCNPYNIRVGDWWSDEEAQRKPQKR